MLNFFTAVTINIFAQRFVSFGTRTLITITHLPITLGVIFHKPLELANALYA